MKKYILFSFKLSKKFVENLMYSLNFFNDEEKEKYNNMMKKKMLNKMYIHVEFYSLKYDDKNVYFYIYKMKNKNMDHNYLEFLLSLYFLEYFMQKSKMNYVYLSIGIMNKEMEKMWSQNISQNLFWEYEYDNMMKKMKSSLYNEMMMWLESKEKYENMYDESPNMLYCKIITPTDKELFLSEHMKMKKMFKKMMIKMK